MNEKKENFSMKKIIELLKESKKDDGTFLDSLYNLYFLIEIAKGLDDAKNNRGITLEQFDREMEARYESDNRFI